MSLPKTTGSIRIFGVGINGYVAALPNKMEVTRLIYGAGLSSGTGYMSARNAVMSDTADVTDFN